MPVSFDHKTLGVADLKTAQEVREHARKVQQRINAQRPLPEPVVEPPKKVKLKQQLVQEPNQEWQNLPTHPIRSVLMLTSYHFNVPADIILGTRRAGPCITPRWVWYYLCYQFGFTLTMIAKYAGRDHTTVVYGIKTIRGRIDMNEKRIIEAVNIIGSEIAAKVFKVQWIPVECGT